MFYKKGFFGIFAMIVIALAIVAVIIYLSIVLFIPKESPQKPINNNVAYLGKSIPIQFNFPSDKLNVAENSGEISLTHGVPFTHHDFCDFKGDKPDETSFTDFSATIKLFDKNFHDTVKSEQGNDFASQNLDGNSLKLSEGFIDKAVFGSLDGFRITSGVEGCGMYTYYFPIINATNTLKITKQFVPELTDLNADKKVYESLPGVILPNQADSIFNGVVSSINLTYNL